MTIHPTPFLKFAALPVPAEDALAYFEVQLPRTRRLRALTALDLMYGYYCDE